MVHYAPKKTCNNMSIINHLGIKGIKNNYRTFQGNLGFIKNANWFFKKC